MSARTSAGARYVTAFLSSAPWWKRSLVGAKAGGEAKMTGCCCCDAPPIDEPTLELSVDALRSLI